MVIVVTGVHPLGTMTIWTELHRPEAGEIFWSGPQRWIAVPRTLLLVSQ